MFAFRNTPPVANRIGMFGTAVRAIQSSSRSELAARAAVVIAIAGAAALLWYTADVLVLLFGSVIVAVALRSLTAIATRYTPLRGGWALAMVTAVLLLAILGLGALIGSRVADQFGQLMQTMQHAVTQARAALEKSQLGRTLVHAESMSASATSLTHLAGMASSSVGAVTEGVLMLFIGLFLAAEPSLYRRGVLALIPVSARGRTARLLDELDHALTRWLQGVVVAMICVGVMTTVGLLLLGIPLALSLGILAGVCEFVPYLGPIVSSIPAILVGFTHGAVPAMEVVGLFLIVHALEAYVLVPLIQKRAVALPPALGLVAVLLFGWVFGPLGVILAHPLMVSIIVLVRQLYIGREAMQA
jgi:predicted PurR-regulated permease PerM